MEKLGLIIYSLQFLMWHTKFSDESKHRHIYFEFMAIFSVPMLFPYAHIFHQFYL